MRLILLFVLTITSYGLSASPCDPYSPFEWSEGGVRYGFSINKESMLNYPQTPLDKGLPISIGEAISSANRKLSEEVSGINVSDFEEAAIFIYSCLDRDHQYMYRVSYSKVDENNRYSGNYSVLVKMNGEVLLPIILNPQIKTKKAVNTLKIEIENSGYFVNGTLIGKKDEIVKYLDSLDSHSYKKVVIIKDSKVKGSPHIGLGDYLMKLGFPSPSMTIM